MYESFVHYSQWLVALTDQNSRCLKVKLSQILFIQDEEMILSFFGVSVSNLVAEERTQQSEEWPEHISKLNNCVEGSFNFPHWIQLIAYYANESMLAAFILACACLLMHILIKGLNAAELILISLHSEHANRQGERRDVGMFLKIQKKYSTAIFKFPLRCSFSKIHVCPVVQFQDPVFDRKVTSLLTSRAGNLNTKPSV